jgi:hypothetical protein
LSSRPKRTRFSSFAIVATTTGAVSCKGNRMKLINATELDRKSGERSGEISLWILFPGNVSRQEIRSGRVAKRSAFILELKRMQFAIFHLPFAIPFKKANWICPHSGTPDANGSLCF